MIRKGALLACLGVGLSIAPAAAAQTPLVGGGESFELTTRAGLVGLELPLVWTPKAGVEVHRLLVHVRRRGSERDDFKVLRTARESGSFVVTLSCEWTTRAGELELYAEGLAKDGAVLVEWGSAAAPRRLPLVAVLPAGVPAPRLPDGSEPERCDATAQATPAPRAESTAPRRYWLGLDLEQAALFLPRTEDVCLSDSWVCAKDGRDVATSSRDALRVSPGGAGRSRGGLARSATRVVGVFDVRFAQVWQLSARVGYAVAGGNPTAQPGTFPYLLEARVAYHFRLSSAVEPYVAVAGGAAQFDGTVGSVVVVPRDAAEADPGSCPTAAEPDRQCLVGSVQAYRTAGRGFVTAGVGARLRLSDGLALQAEGKLLLPLPTWSPGVSAQVGVRFAL